MSGETPMFLLLAVFMVQATCQQDLKVIVSPNLPLDQIFSGDTFYLSCGGNGSGDAVKWYLNGVEQMTTNKTWKIAAASGKHSGIYHCKSNSEESNRVNIAVLEYLPSASLSILTGHPVMQVGASVILRLNNEDGLKGWRCWVYRGDRTKRIALRLKGEEVSFDFRPRRFTVHETILWCSDETEKHRSNQVIVRTSGNRLSLEMYPLPAIEGETLTLRCYVWGTDQISHTIFYKDNKPIQDSASPTYNIPDVPLSAMGSYKCKSTFTYVAQTAGPLLLMESDYQDVLVHSRLPRASLSDNLGMSCSCTLCPSDSDYRWYHRSGEGQPWVLVSSGRAKMPEERGTYACRAVWSNGRSLLSDGYAYQSPFKFMVLAVIMVLLILGLAITALGFYLRYRRRTKEPIYEDVAHTSGKNEYEMLRKPHGAKEGGEYHTLHPKAGGSQRKEGEYQALKKEEMQEGVYHTVQMHEAAGGEGGYEALKKEDMKGGEYQTLNTESAGGKEGGEKEETIVTVT
ncbi:sialoadhesin [Halichoeres trimaculatus]|uniref:sialoadhesin n=1 Tax=Halichoeres trimaculatus TaxID=147232 RepID=UPI003D9F120E